MLDPSELKVSSTVSDEFEVADPDEDEQFTYDILGNRITLNPRVGANVVYASNTVNEYTNIGGVTPLYDASTGKSVPDPRRDLSKADSPCNRAVIVYNAKGPFCEKSCY